MDVKKIRLDFPVLKRKVNGKPLVYLDNAATTQKPKQVIDKLSDYYNNYNANVHRGIHALSEEATAEYENAREKIAKFIGAQSNEIVFTKNTTESLNILAYSALRTLKPGDEVVLSVMEHHSNIVPWQMLREKGVKLKFVDINKDGTLKDELKNLVTRKTKIVSITHSSNVLGTINPVKEIGKIAHENGAILIVDGAQSVPHMPVDIKNLDCDFLAFSSHKMLGPTGIGVLYGQHDAFKNISPFLRGGDMIKEVHLQDTKWNDMPWRFEAGTPNIADVIGFGAAIDYLQKIGMGNIRKHEIEITKYALNIMNNITGLTVHGLAKERGSAVSFSMKGVHPHDIATILNSEGIAIRSGHLCAQPLMERLNVPAVGRASFYIYNTKEEVDKLAEGLEKVKKVFK